MAKTRFGKKGERAPVISVVDDDQSVREATKSFLRSLDYEVTTFGTAEDFLASTQVATTACLITDVHMPGIGGVELQDHLIASGRRVPMIFITAFPDVSLKRAR
jgi:FixJ family two-component response regulator